MMLCVLAQGLAKSSKLGGFLRTLSGPVAFGEELFFFCCTASGVGKFLIGPTSSVASSTQNKYETPLPSSLPPRPGFAGKSRVFPKACKS